jgi:hypothetical protein
MTTRPVVITGRYLQQVFEQLRAAAPAGVRVRPVLGPAVENGGMSLLAGILGYARLTEPVRFRNQ